MIFAIETDEKALLTFATEAEAVAHCEGLDVEAAVWLFWNDRGEPLEPSFSVPNKRGIFTVRNGVYSLVPASPHHHGTLIEVLEDVESFEGPAPFDSVEGVRAHLETKTP
jgi:hypothetical protein